MRYAIAMTALALAACNQTAPKQTGGQADGEILPGSASDAMLPLDTIRSQPPLAPRVEVSARPAEKGAAPARRSADDGGDPPPAATEPEAPAEPAKAEGE